MKLSFVDRLLLVTSMLFCNFILINAQDMIVLKNGDIISAKVREIDDSTIKYHKFTNLDGPIYNIGINKVLSINYENGEKDLFDLSTNTSSTEPNINSNGEVFVKTSEDNSSIISKYSKEFTTNHLKIRNKSAKFVLTKFSPTPNSILSNEDIEISFRMPHMFLYEIWIKNKTDKPIMIDLGNSFRVDSDNLSRRYFVQSETTSVSSGKANGGAVNLGSVASALGADGVLGTIASGVSVGGGNSYSSTTTYSNERIVVVPPMGVAPLSSWHSVETTPGFIASRKWITYGENLYMSDKTQPMSYNDEGIMFSSFASANFDAIPDINMPFVEFGSIHIDESKTYNLYDSPLKKEYSIRYYKDEQFNTYSTLKFGLYLKQIVGTAYDLKIYNGKKYNALGFVPDYDIMGISICK